MIKDYLGYLLSHKREVSYSLVDRGLGILSALPEIPAWSNREIARPSGGEEVISSLKAEEPLKLESRLKRQPIAI